MSTQHLFAPVFAAAAAAAFALAGLAAATPAHAGEATYDYPTSVQSALTRPAVKVEALRARAAGEVSSGEYAHVAPAAGLSKTRAQVVAETREAVRLGLVSPGEQAVFPTAQQLARIEVAGLAALNMTVAAR